MNQAQIYQLVGVAMSCFISSLISEEYFYLPAFLALLFPAAKLEAAVGGMIISLFMGVAVKLWRASHK